ncbi:GH36-type glycosyl hydrolase domain-containing protein [Povalibacter sp.]|uniref:GH36-type glycosyl hydrolase domain-containing protein n=1 Tax=Povalibacter sp. TaxID=1962978 RepID=UPI002F3EE80C
MTRQISASTVVRLAGAQGLSITIDDSGCIRRIDCNDTLVNLFVGNAVENGPANLYLRLHTGRSVGVTPLLGPGSPTRGSSVAVDRWVGSGTWEGMRYTVSLTLARNEPAWFWHVHVVNRGTAALSVDLIYTQDIGLAPYAMARLNEYYLSQYVDHTPLRHPVRGWVIASRQNLGFGGRTPWSLIGSLRRSVGFATDALQLATRGDGNAPLQRDLPSRRRQHEHSMAAVQDERTDVPAGGHATFGFFGLFRDDHPAATSTADLALVDAILAQPEASQAGSSNASVVRRLASTSTLFSAAPRFQPLLLEASTLRSLFPGRWRHKESSDDGTLLSFFYGDSRHVVLRDKEWRVLRPHGHLLRTGRRATPDESALTSTVWMAGVFHSMLTQGHVSFNRLLSTVHSYVGLFRSHGQRVFVDTGSGWQLLDVPSAFEMTPTVCRWIYQHQPGLIEVRSEACSDPHEMQLEIVVRSGPPVRCLITHHLALNGDDGSESRPARWSMDNDVITLSAAPGTELHQRFPEGSFRITVDASLEKVGGDEILFSDGRSRQLPFLCIVTERAGQHRLRIEGCLVVQEAAPAAHSAIDATSLPIIELPEADGPANAVAPLVEILPWFAHNALIHYLSPRGLEQYSGGGWGTRDVTQGPVEMLLALGKTLPVRDLLLRVMAAQKSDGDWPQWFMFFERDRAIRAGDSHGDIVFWPVLALAQYLIASGDHGVLEERVAFFEGDEQFTVWQHVEKALAVIAARIIPGTSLAAYGHGDWNDSLQPADPAMRERLCSAWTVTLHHQTLTTLARALRPVVGKQSIAERLDADAAGVARDFQRLLLIDDVLTGYAMFDGETPRYLLHPRDETTGVHYSALAMIHAILEGLLTPAQVEAHLQVIRSHLTGPDGVRLFDRPMPYHGGPQRFFQRAESATFFGREIGLMYMHAHLRYAQALAHVGDAEGFFHALCQANPVGLASIVPTASLRQANCYYSSSDAAFADRYEASTGYERVAAGMIALDGGWRVYSSGAGIALGLIVRRFLGLNRECESLCIDPVMSPRLSGLKVRTRLCDHDVEVTYLVGPAGCGVSSVVANGKVLPMTRDAHPYRSGAARIAVTDLAAELQTGLNAVVVHVD